MRRVFLDTSGIVAAMNLRDEHHELAKTVFLQAIANIREATAGYIAALEEDGLPVPEEYRRYAQEWYARLDLTAY